MDSRNIKESIPEIKDGRYLEKIYSLQKELLEEYINIEGLPQYPIDVNSKKNQIILKDFTGRIIEELAEGFESQLKVQKLSSDNGYFNDNFMSKEPGKFNKSFSEAKNHIQNINEELSDATHFMMELLIYTNIYSSHIEKYMEKLKEEYKIIGQLNYGVNKDILQEAMNIGLFLITKDDLMDIHKYHIDPTNSFDSDPCTPIGWDTSEFFIEHIMKVLWDITYSLSISRNCLKNKPWKQSGQLTDEQTYQNLIAESFIKLCGYFKLIGLTSKTLFGIYFLKNEVNKFRIKSKY